MTGIFVASRVMTRSTNASASGPCTRIWRSTATFHSVTSFTSDSYSTIIPPSSGRTYPRGWYMRL